MIDSLSIVFPIFNEEKRLNIMIEDINDFNEKNKTVNLQYVFVNDGSNDNTQKILNSFISNNKKKEIEYLLIDLDFSPELSLCFSLIFESVVFAFSLELSLLFWLSFVCVISFFSYLFFCLFSLLL